MPAGKASYDLPTLAQYWPSWVENYKNGTLFEGAVSVPRFNGITSVQPEFANAVQAAVLGQTTPQEALDTAQANAQSNYDLMTQ